MYRNSLKNRIQDWLACSLMELRIKRLGTDLKRHRCYLCCRNGADTDEHIPPKCIYHKDYRNSNLITVPAHESCNGVFSKDDEYFRDNIVLAVADINPKASKLFSSKVLRSFKRKESGGYRARFQKEIGNVEIRTEGGLFLKNAPIKSFDAETIYRMMNRITRGIYYNLTKMVLPRNWPIKTIMVQSDVAQHLKRMDGTPYHHAIVPGIFEYYSYSTRKDDRHSTNFYVFYEAFVFLSYAGSEARKVKDKPLEKYDSLNGIKFTDRTLWVPKGQI
jgi:hypothetical protein